jgi:hypothetical protein
MGAKSEEQIGKADALGRRVIRYRWSADCRLGLTGYFSK